MANRHKNPFINGGVFLLNHSKLAIQVKIVVYILALYIQKVVYLHKETNQETMKLTVTEVSRATFTSSKFESTVDDLIRGGWNITENDWDALEDGKSVQLNGPNRNLLIKKVV